MKAIASLFALLLVAATAHTEGIKDYRARTVYFLLTDRFNPQTPYSPYVDPEYPDATNSVDCLVIVCTQEKQWRSYWGGDIAGLIQRLGYLQDLGIPAVWVTPLMENVRAYEGGTGYGTGYHGYWVQNYDRVNAHFGNWQSVRELSRELHARGMRYIEDITLNDSNPLDNHVFGALYRSAYADQVLVQSYDDDFGLGPIRAYKHFQSDPRCQQAEMESDTDWSYWQLHHCLLPDLAGYNQHNRIIADYLVDAGRRWMNAGADDFRLDAVKFPFPEFIARFTNTMIAYAQQSGRSAPYFVGEWSGGGVGDSKSLTFANAYPIFKTNIFDFTLSLALNQFVGGSYEDPSQQLNAQGLDMLLQQRVAAFNGRDDWQGTFIDNHDQMRTLVRLQKLGVDEAERDRRLDLATVLLMTVRGIPVIYYGDEQYLAYYDDGSTPPPQDINSTDDDPYNRPGMRGWSENTPAFRIIRVLADLRRRSKAIAAGSYDPVYADNDVLVFERRSGNEIVFVAVNRGAAATISLGGDLGLPPGTYRGLLANTSEVNKENSLTVAPGKAVLVLGPLSALVVEGNG
jgi:cyclomaltodextrin glucanotransferase